MSKMKVLIKNVISIPYRLFFTKISIFAGLQDSRVDKKSAICKGVRFYRSNIGKYSYVGNNTFITNTHIGNFTSIAGNCFIGGTSHPINWVSTASVFHKEKNILKKNFSNFEYKIFQETYIGNDVWIGEGCKIKSGVRIEDGAIIGMGAVLTKDVGPYEIWAGNPAKLIRKRFDDEVIQKLRKNEWWTWEDTMIEKYAKYFNEPKLFIGMMDNEE